MGFILSLFGGWRALAFLGAAIALGGYVLYLKADAADARADAAQAVLEARHWQAQAVTYAAAQKATLEALDRLKAEAERAESVLRRERDRARAQADLNDSIARDILNAPETDSAPAAPVLDRALDRLQLRQQGPGEPGVAPGGGDPGGEGEPAPDAPALR
jgi:hypothetical protein